ncbi:MAG: cysteine--tRNA ligase [Alphaproteobacteria bacterium]
MSDRPTEGFKGLRLSNTLTRQKEDFVPIDPANVRMYVCGPTVYDFAHIGNARPAIVFDVLFRLLRHLYGESHVTYVRNITDVDDKINARAGREYPDLPLNEAIRKVTGPTERQYHEDAAALGCLPPTKEPRATEHMAGMIAMIEQLIARNNAYVADGHALFDVRSWKAADGSLEYGRLANRSLEDMIAGARVEVAPYKRDPMDFVLWKPSTQGEPAWPSPWGEGRPGWHLECSVMAGEYLGDIFDIHGGGVDLVFPHHENEIAQSRCAHGTTTMANYWLHNGYLQVEGEKMSKSTGNFITIRDVLHDWPGDVVRLAMLKTHYRQPIDWTLAALRESAAVLESWADATSGSGPGMFCADVTNALQDDLNTPQAIAALHELRKPATGGFGGARASLMAGANMLGLLTEPAHDRESNRRRALKLDENAIADRVSARLAAREAKDFAEADRIRGELEAMGIRLMDRKDPATSVLATDWEVKR